MYSGFNKLMIGFYILMACVLVALLVAWDLGIWDADATFVRLHERMAETWETLKAFGRGLLQLL